jgi:hypothetical protein
MLNDNYGDTAQFERIHPDASITICSRSIGNTNQAEPAPGQSGPDPEHCRYSRSDISEPAASVR